MTRPLFRDDPYAADAPATVIAHHADGIVLDASVFYPTGGGQAGDVGHLAWDGGTAAVATTIKGTGSDIVLCLASDAPRPAVGARVAQTLDWAHRHACMRLHTGLHLLSVVIPLPVTGGQITAQKGRLDFDMPDAPEDKAALNEALRALIAADHPVTETWISDDDLAARPDLVKTMSVKPPTGAGRVRLVRIGDVDAPVDLQPCGGTHVRSTAEVGPVRLGKIEKKGRRNRRVNLFLDDPDE